METTGAELPFSFIASEILSRIPAKSDIGRCRCVCKQWNSFLSTPTFTRMHLRRHVTINDYKQLLFDAQSPVPFNKTLLNPNPNPKPAVLRIIASLDGLVCLGSWEPPGTLMFWNPFTGAYKKLASIPGDMMLTRKVFFRDAIGFYTDSCDDYKLVCLLTTGWAHVYSHRLDSWRKIECSFFRYEPMVTWGEGTWSQGTFCGRCVYFTVRTHFLEQPRIVTRSLIICFDVEKETFREIPFPPIPDGGGIDYSGTLVVLNGCLHVSVSSTIRNGNVEEHGDLWRLDDGDEWVKVAAFSDPGEQERHRICTASVGNWLAVLDKDDDDDCFKKMNTEDFTSHYRYFCSVDRGYRSSRIIYAETLVSP